MAVLDVAQFVGQHAGHLVAAFGPIDQPAQQDHPPAGGRERIDHALVDHPHIDRLADGPDGRQPVGQPVKGRAALGGVAQLCIAGHIVHHPVTQRLSPALGHQRRQHGRQRRRQQHQPDHRRQHRRGQAERPQQARGRRAVGDLRRLPGQPAAHVAAFQHQAGPVETARGQADAPVVGIVVQQQQGRVGPDDGGIEAGRCVGWRVGWCVGWRAWLDDQSVGFQHADDDVSLGRLAIEILAFERDAVDVQRTGRGLKDLQCRRHRPILRRSRAPPPWSVRWL